MVLFLPILLSKLREAPEIVDEDEVESSCSLLPLREGAREGEGNIRSSEKEVYHHTIYIYTAPFSRNNSSSCSRTPPPQMMLLVCGQILDDAMGCEKSKKKQKKYMIPAVGLCTCTRMYNNKKLIYMYMYF